MKTLFLDCGMGAAGDMLTAALLELLPEPDAFVRRLNDLGIPGVEFVRIKTDKCGIAGTQMSVRVHGAEEGEEPETEHGHTHDHEHLHEHLHEHEHTHEHEHEHTHEHGHTHGHGQDGRELERERGYADSHDPARLEADGHIHVHDTCFSYEHEEGHGHTHGHGHHHHSGMEEIRHIVTEHMALPPEIAGDVMKIYEMIAEAESRVHGVPVDRIHFHEVGAMDAVADITAVCLLMREIAPDAVVVSPVHVGSGHVHCAHGILPVPAPATALLLKGVPVYGGEIRGELCTPTGAALLKYFAARFGPMPSMLIEKVGYGFGKKEFPVLNCVRAMLGSSAETGNEVLELSCNVDDMTAEEVGFAMERLLEGGALDVYTVAVGMKKNRPGILLRTMCVPGDRQKMLNIMYKYTSTIGIRETRTQRYILDRRVDPVRSPYGEIRVKTAAGYGVSRRKYEYEDLARIARERGLSLAEVRKLLDAEIRPSE